MRRHHLLFPCLVLSAVAALVACDGDTPPPDGGAMDSGPRDAGAEDGAMRGCAEPADCNDGNECNGSETCSLAGICVRGTPVADGTECDRDPMLSRELCFRGFCQPSVCGDGFVDVVRTEECDDGNDVSGDGCEPLSCDFSCGASSDCDDENPCTGAETCDTSAHTCVAGTSLAEGAACGTDLVCRGGACLPVGCGNGFVDTGEDCEPPGSASCRADCTWVCEVDDDCDDGDACNGGETCTASAHECVAGTVLTCTLPDACHTSVCSTRLGGCLETLIDVDGDLHAASALGTCGDDCDDAVASVYAGAPEICDGLDNDCNGMIDDMALLWYVDCDGDGFAASGAMSRASCIEPPADETGCVGGGRWTVTPPGAGATDCADANPSVFPGEGRFFPDAYSGAGGVPSWDYDCDGDEDLQYSLRGRCVLAAGGTCTERRGFVFGATESAPDCGSTGTFLQRCSMSCSPVLTLAIPQTCN